MPNSIIRLSNVDFSYANKKVLENVNLNIEQGMFMGLIGPNGGGKSTLIQLVLGLLTPEKGDIHLLNQPINQFKQWNRIGFVSQKANTFNKGFPATVFEVVSMGLTAKIGYFHFLKKQDKQRVYEAISLVGMDDEAHSNIGNLSGGQQQRIFIARALVSEPELLILDEPTVGIDYQNVDRFYELLHRLNKEENITLLLVSHDTGVLTKYATNVVCLNKTLHFHGNSEEYTALSTDYLSEVYGHPVQVVVHDHG